MQNNTQHASTDGAGVFRASAANGLLATYAGIRGEGPAYRGLTVRECAELAVARAGAQTLDMKPAQVLAYAMTSSDFPSIVAAGAAAALRTGYYGFNSTWRRFAAIGSVPDFKRYERPQVGGFGGIDLVSEAGEYQSRPVLEDRTQISVDTRGRMLSCSRELLINDELGLFLDRALRLGVAVARAVNTAAYAYLTQGASANGPTMTDTGQLFNSTAVTTAGGHANLAGTGAAISAATLAAGKLAMRKQTDRDSTRPLGITPRTLLVPEALVETAWAQAGVATWGANDATDAHLSNAGRLQVVTDPELDVVSATGWYLIADPLIAPLFEVAFLNGAEAPFIDENLDFDTDAIRMKVRIDFGFAARDFRAGYRNAGA